MTVSSPATTLRSALLEEILRGAHGYEPGREPYRGASGADPRTPAQRRRERMREGARDLIERAAGAAGFSRRHFDPEEAARRLTRILDLEPGLEQTFAELGDESSRRTMLGLLRLRVLGPFHASLELSPERYRELQAQAERDLVIQPATIEVPDPWFSPLSLYRIPPESGSDPRIELHTHSVDVVNVYVRHEYRYRTSTAEVAAEPGDTVLDIGGCWGDTALYFARQVGQGGRVITFEFDPRNLAVMRWNLSLNPELAARIEVVEQALWSESGLRLPFAAGGRMTRVLAGAVGEVAGHAATDTATAEVEDVLTTTLDEALQKAGVDHADFVKMDVEGAEPHVLAGAKETLSRHRPKLALAAYHADNDLVTLPAELRSQGLPYRLYLRATAAVEDETVLFAQAVSRSSST